MTKGRLGALLLQISGWVTSDDSMSSGSATLKQRLQVWDQPSTYAILNGMVVGVEREALRVDGHARLSRAPHPHELGAALTHPYITTDYSEALIELITPPDTLARTHAFLVDLHRHVYGNIHGELLWAGSMPCVMALEPEIPLARYGTSNAALMKTIYRRGLGYRYGRAMQAIAGIHFNCSLPAAFWQQEAGADASADYISERYFDLLRNLLRCGWLIPYLFGASPAICASFIDQEHSELEEFDIGTYYGPHATSLRMGDIGYQNKQETSMGVQANYNSRQDYIDSLVRATSTVCPEYEKIGIRRDGDYLQLNAKRLQIENEYYGSVRPKCVPHGNEKPSRGLRRRGVEYVELRSLDINPLEPCGLGITEMHFLTALVLYCVLEASPPIEDAEYQVIDRNLQQVAHHGRDPDLVLQRNQATVPLQVWAEEILTGIGAVSELLDRAEGGSDYRAAHQAQQVKVANASHTPSAQIIEQMQSEGKSYVEWTSHQSQVHQQHFAQARPNAELETRLARIAEESFQKQKQMEQVDTQSFEEYLADYEAQA